MPAPVVVKIGGSLLESRRLPRLLDICTGAARPVVLVSGGGKLADEVRRLQKRLKFNDAAAHKMAILAMHQTALMFGDLQPGVVPCETRAAISAALAQGKVPVWLPLGMAVRDRAIPADWTITSDGLAARLAERIGAGAVYLVKQVRAEASATPEKLARAGLVDTAFPAIVARAGLEWRIFGPGEDASLARLLGSDTKPRDGGRRR
jgi:aspartokinase-like uncharacterized kinase